MTAEQKMCDDPTLGIILTDRGTGWVAATVNRQNGGRVLVKLNPASGKEEEGYWHLRATFIDEAVEEKTRRPLSPYGIGLILSAMGVDLSRCEWTREPIDA
jgi:hypothetical protein